MHVGITHIHADRIVAMLALYLGKAISDQFKGLIPANRLPMLTYAFYRLTQTLRIILDVLQGDGLGADVPTAEAVFWITLNRQNALAFGFYRQATDGLAQMTSTKMGNGHRFHQAGFIILDSL